MDIKSSLPIICLMGPTASGKTEAAIALAKHFPCEIISVDSAMVYCNMDIGTAKPSLAIRQEIPHHLIDICDIKENYSAGQFCKDGMDAIKNVLAKNKIPLLVGGTMLYFRALLFGLSSLPSADKSIRLNIDQQAKTLGWPALHESLSQVDPITAARLHPNDAQRIQRAYEVYLLTGLPLSQFHQEKHGFLQGFPLITIALLPHNRLLLKQRITERFHHMLQQGFIDEVKKLYTRGDLSPSHSAIRAVGYRQIWDYLSGNIDEATMIQNAIIATHQLAKRQLTWLRQWPDLQAFIAETPDLMVCLVDFLQHKIAQYQKSEK
jgi:tRNA dimethylallyltransferase